MCCAHFVVSVRFLGPSLSFMLVYVWARKNPYTNLSFLGVFNFTAPFLPWVLLAFSVMLGGSPLVDLLGMLAGICGFTCTRVYPYRDSCLWRVAWVVDYAGYPVNSSHWSTVNAAHRPCVLLLGGCVPTNLWTTTVDHARSAQGTVSRGSTPPASHPATG